MEKRDSSHDPYTVCGRSTVPASGGRAAQRAEAKRMNNAWSLRGFRGAARPNQGSDVLPQPPGAITWNPSPNQKETDGTPQSQTISYVKDFKHAILEQPFVSGWNWGSRHLLTHGYRLYGRLDWFLLPRGSHCVPPKVRRLVVTGAATCVQLRPACFQSLLRSSGTGLLPRPARSPL